MENKIALFNVYGIKCDNDSCDYNEPTVPVTEYYKGLNKPCPKCGHNLLTQADFENVLNLIDYNGLSWTELLDKFVPNRKSDDIINRISLKMNGTGNIKVEAKDY